MMPLWNEATELKTAELHIQTSELSVFGDRGGKRAWLAEWVDHPSPKDLEPFKMSELLQEANAQRAAGMEPGVHFI
jgi:hypothetical protein